MVKRGQEPLAGANVFIMGTIDGCLTDSLGRFSFSTSKTGEASIKITMIGFEEYIEGEGVCFIEWANLIEELLPAQYTEIHIDKDLSKGFDYRLITVEEVQR